MLCKEELETFIWVGDGMAPAGPHLIGAEYTAEDGRKGVVVEATALTVTIKYKEPSKTPKPVKACTAWDYDKMMDRYLFIMVVILYLLILYALITGAI